MGGGEKSENPELLNDPLFCKRYVQANLWRILGIFVLAADSSHRQQTYHTLSLGYGDDKKKTKLKHKDITIPYLLAPATQEMVNNPAGMIRMAVYQAKLQHFKSYTCRDHDATTILAGMLQSLESVDPPPIEEFDSSHLVDDALMVPGRIFNDDSIHSKLNLPQEYTVGILKAFQKFDNQGSDKRVYNFEEEAKKSHEYRVLLALEMFGLHAAKNFYEVVKKSEYVERSIRGVILPQYSEDKRRKRKETLENFPKFVEWLLTSEKLTIKPHNRSNDPLKVLKYRVRSLLLPLFKLDLHRKVFTQGRRLNYETRMPDVSKFGILSCDMEFFALFILASMNNETLDCLKRGLKTSHPQFDQVSTATPDQDRDRIRGVALVVTSLMHEVLKVVDSRPRNKRIQSEFKNLKSRAVIERDVLKIGEAIVPLALKIVNNNGWRIDKDSPPDGPELSHLFSRALIFQGEVAEELDKLDSNLFEKCMRKHLKDEIPEINTSALNVGLREFSKGFFSFREASLHTVLSSVWWSHMILTFLDFHKNGNDDRKKRSYTSYHPALEDVADGIVKVFDEVGKRDGNVKELVQSSSFPQALRYVFDPPNFISNADTETCLRTVVRHLKIKMYEGHSSHFTANIYKKQRSDAEGQKGSLTNNDVKSLKRLLGDYHELMSGRKKLRQLFDQLPSAVIEKSEEEINVSFGQGTIMHEFLHPEQEEEELMALQYYPPEDETPENCCSYCKKPEGDTWCSSCGGPLHQVCWDRFLKCEDHSMYKNPLDNNMPLCYPCAKKTSDEKCCCNIRGSYDVATRCVTLLNNGEDIARCVQCGNTGHKSCLTPIYRDRDLCNSCLIQKKAQKKVQEEAAQEGDGDAAQEIDGSFSTRLKRVLSDEELLMSI